MLILITMFRYTHMYINVSYSDLCPFLCLWLYAAQFATRQSVGAMRNRSASACPAAENQDRAIEPGGSRLICFGPGD